MTITRDYDAIADLISRMPIAPDSRIMLDNIADLAIDSELTPDDLDAPLTPAHLASLAQLIADETAYLDDYR